MKESAIRIHLLAVIILLVTTSIPVSASPDVSDRYYNILTVTIDTRLENKEKEDNFVFKDMNKINGYVFAFSSDHGTYGCPIIDHNLRLRPVFWGDVFISFEATHFSSLSKKHESYETSEKNNCSIDSSSNQINIRAIAGYPSTFHFSGFSLSFEMPLNNIF